MSDFKDLILGDTLDGWKIFPRGIGRCKEGTPEYENDCGP